MRFKCQFCQMPCFMIPPNAIAPNSATQYYEHNYTIWDCQNHYDEDVVMVRHIIRHRRKQYINHKDISSFGDVRSLELTSIIWQDSEKDKLYRANWEYYFGNYFNVFQLLSEENKGMYVYPPAGPFLLELKYFPPNLTPENIKQKIPTLINFA